MALGLIVSALPATAATTTVDLDAQTANGSESQCDLNVLQSFPVKIENVVTNRAIGDAFNFSWPSAGPGGFTSSATPGTAGGVGAKWTWTTNQTVYSFTGNSCANDICFAKTAGPDAEAGRCSLACLDDGVSLTVRKGAASGEIDLSWSGGTANYTVYRGTNVATVDDPANALLTTSALSYADVPPSGTTVYYKVRASNCVTTKPCQADSGCNPVNEGTCINRGPFFVPGRSLTTTDITVSSSSLTSSLITFFSPPKEVFRITNSSSPGGVQETLTNSSTAPITVVTEASPPGCCPANPSVPHQLRCGDVCVDYLNDPENCGGCGIVCGDDSCCSEGVCTPVCQEGQILCGGVCVDPSSDNANCGACGNDCGDVGCCSAGECVSACGDGSTFCNGFCYDLTADPQNCGGCGNACPSGNSCTNGACVACNGDLGGTDVCGDQCVDLSTDPYNCGSCGVSCNTHCGEGTRGVCSGSEGLYTCTCVEGSPGPPPPPGPSSTPPTCTPGDPEKPGTPVSCPSSGSEAPTATDTPTCDVDGTSTTVPPGGSSTTCRPGGLLFKEVPSAVSACGDSLPGPNGVCLSGVSHVSQGTYMRLVPDTSKTVGDAYVTPYAVHIKSDSSGDGLLEPGETATFTVDVLNAGPFDVTGSSATLTAPAIDLTSDGIDNPVGITVTSGSSAFGTIRGTTPPASCTPVTLNPASSASAFQVTIPPTHPGDTSHPFNLAFTGMANGHAFSMNVPFTLGIADNCQPSAHTRDFDGLEGLYPPMANLVPDSEPPPFPSTPDQSGRTAPLKLNVFCGGVKLTDAGVDAPELVALSEATRGPIPVSTLWRDDPSSGSANTPFFEWDCESAVSSGCSDCGDDVVGGCSAGQWMYGLRTTNLGTGTFTITIRIAGRKNYVTGFVLR